MAKKRKVSDIATQRKTSVDDVLAHLKKAGIEVVDGEVDVDDEAIDKAYRGARGGACAAAAGGPGGKRAASIIDAGASRRGGGPQGGRDRRRGRGRGRDRDEQRRAGRRPTGLVKVPSGSTVKDISQLLGVSTPEIIKALMGYGEMVTITQTLSDEAIEVLATDFEPRDRDHARGRRRGGARGGGRRRPRGPQAARRRSSPSWATSTTARRACSTPSATPRWRPARPAASRSTSAPTRCKHNGQLDHLHRHARATRRSPPCAPAAPRSPTSPRSSSPPTTASCRRPSRPSTTPRRRGVPIVIVVNKIDKPERQHRAHQAAARRARHRARGMGRRHRLRRGRAPRSASASTTSSTCSCSWPRSPTSRPTPTRRPAAFIIESQRRPGPRRRWRRCSSTAARIRVGDAVVAGEASGRVRAMRDFKRRAAQERRPVDAGRDHRLRRAARGRRVLPRRQGRARGALARRRGAPTASRPRRSPSSTRSRSTTSSRASPRARSLDLNLVVKADVQGSLEALSDALLKIQHPEVKVRIIHSGVGGINESDVMLASASTAIIIGFNVRPSPQATALAESEGVDMRTYRVIYKVTEDITAALVGMLKPTIERGRARPGRGAHDVQGLQAGHHRRLHGHARHDRAQRQRARAARRRRRPRRQDRLAQALRRKTRARSWKASSAASCSTASTTSRKGDVLEAYETREVAREG